jgi:hypothetical protein
MSRSSVLLKSTTLYSQMPRHGTRTSKGSQTVTRVVFMGSVCAVQRGAVMDMSVTGAPCLPGAGRVPSAPSAPNEAPGKSNEEKPAREYAVNDRARGASGSL